MTLALLGEEGLDLRKVETGSMKLQHAPASNAGWVDVNGDGQLDLVATFDSSQFRLNQPGQVGLTASLKNSQLLVAKRAMMAAPPNAPALSPCSGK